MTCPRRPPLRLAALFALALAASCAKGGTSLDEDAHDDPPAALGPLDGSSGSGSAGSGSGAECGDGKVDPGEDCDGDDLNGVTCVNLGFDGGPLACDPTTCMFDTSMCMREPSTGGGGNGG